MREKTCRLLCNNFEQFVNFGLIIIGVGGAYIFCFSKFSLFGKFVIAFSPIVLYAIICAVFKQYLQKKVNSADIADSTEKEPSTKKRYIVMYFGLFALFILAHPVSNAVSRWAYAIIAITPIAVACLACLLFESKRR